MPQRILAFTGTPGELRAIRSLGNLVVHSDATGSEDRARGEAWALVLVDSSFAEGTGLRLAARLAREGQRVVLMARDPSLRSTLEAIRDGVTDVIPFPPSPERLVSHLSGAETERDATSLTLAESASEADLVGSDPAMLEVFRAIARLGRSGAPVLLIGEPGTGKHTVAAALHRHGARAKGPFVELSCSALPEALIESELFGHEAGTFPWAIARRKGTLERASGGVLFLNHVEELSPRLQMKLTQALQEGAVERTGGTESIPLDVRMVAAAKRDLGPLLEKGEFLEDLYYALTAVALHLPPLRDRPGDVKLLARHFAARAVARHGGDVEAMSGAFVRALEAHHWPGNARELRMVVERAVVLADGPVLEARHLPGGGEWPGEDAPPSEIEEMLDPRASLESVEAAHIRRVLRSTGGNLSQTAEILEIHRNTLRRKLRKYGIRS